MTCLSVRSAQQHEILSLWILATVKVVLRVMVSQSVSQSVSHHFRPKTRKGKVHPRTGHEDPEGEKRYSSTLSLTSEPDGGWVVKATLQSIYPRERPGTHLIGSWVGLRADLSGCGKSRPAGIRSPDRPARSESLHSLCYPGSHPRPDLSQVY